MLGHLGINVPDLAAAKTYYDALMPLVGFTTFFATDDEVAYRPAGGKPGTYLFFYPAAAESAYSKDATGLQHLAFTVKTRSAVHAVHEHVLASGGTVLHAPREFPQYPPPYFATFWTDPFGFTLEAVCHRDAD
ncbi:VOC family protein [Amycolatopsis eburnea]|uniref:Extradiol dioxygenase n=1 Tax=Amycolatopsis eburnea TaxID=2267691 RepID=A0A3R9E7B6_9PSEU|nr:VOC family protein [Amycolatopsis eburnea]RSD25616.1 extradiol dioxygenase [Amycolatopsis eburnea]